MGRRLFKLPRALAALGLSALAVGAVLLYPHDLEEEESARAQRSAVQAQAQAIGPKDPLAGSYRNVDGHLALRLPLLDPGLRRDLSAAVVREAVEARLDPLLVLAVIEVESRFDAEALSNAGAMGLMQLRGPTLRGELRRHGLGGDPADPVVNVRAGVRYLRRLFDAFPREDVALMAYNAGPNRILGYLREGEIPERFHSYPRRVKAVLHRLQRQALALASEDRPAPWPLGQVGQARLLD